MHGRRVNPRVGGGTPSHARDRFPFSCHVERMNSLWITPPMCGHGGVVQFAEACIRVSRWPAARIGGCLLTTRFLLSAAALLCTGGWQRPVRMALRRHDPGDQTDRHRPVGKPAARTAQCLAHIVPLTSGRTPVGRLGSGPIKNAANWQASVRLGTDRNGPGDNSTLFLVQRTNPMLCVCMPLDSALAPGLAPLSSLAHKWSRGPVRRASSPPQKRHILAVQGTVGCLSVRAPVAVKASPFLSLWLPTR